MSLAFKIVVYSVLLCAVIAILAAMIKSKKPVRAIFLTALQGIAAIFAVNVISFISGISLPVNAYTLCAGALGGIPAVTTLLFINYIFKIY